MYLMHKFWARKPHNVVSQYIEHYSKKGDIVLDPFCGSGVAAIESLKLRRKTVAIDLDPIATFITRMSLLPVDLNEYENAFEQLEASVSERINELYETRCPQCGKKAVAICVRWKSENPTRIRNLDCPSCGMVREKAIGKPDLEKINETEQMEIPYWYPKDTKLHYPEENPFLKKEKRDYVHELFTKRNLIALSILYNEIESFKSESIRDLIKLAFSSLLPQASKMVLWSKTSRPSWKVHSYWVPHENVEMNVWDRFENRYHRIYKGKEQIQEQVDDLYREGQSFQELLDDETILISTQSALNLKEKPASISSNSIDYVFTDPPYGGSVQYLELSTIFSSWLRGSRNDPRFQLDFDEEITINKFQHKDFDFYHKMLKASFEEVYRVLRANSWLTVTFHNTSIRIYNSIIKAIVLAGFDLEKIVYQPPAKRGAKQQLQPYGSAIGDYYMRFRKPRKSKKGLPTESAIAKERYERIIVDAVRELIALRGEPTSYSLIINSYAVIYGKLKKNGYFLSNPEGIDKVLKRQLNKEFAIVDGKWWFKDPESVPFIERVPLNERVEISVMDVLNRKVKISFDDVLQYIFIKFPNALTPETRSIIEVLREYANKTKDRKWMLDSNVRRRMREHDKIVEILALIGEIAGYKVHADLQNWRKDAFPKVPSDNVKRVKDIDVVWFTKDEITHEFEVENTTGIWSAIIRGSFIPNGKVKRFIVIPEERQKTFNNKISAPALRERVQRENWEYILYDSLKTFYHSIKRKRKVNLEEFEEISLKPQMPKKIVETLEMFTNEPSHQT